MQNVVPLVYNCLLRTTVPTNDQRKQAEAELKQYEAQQGYGTVLCTILLGSEFPPHGRQLAGIVLKKFVKDHWEESEETFVFPGVTEAEKMHIRSLLPKGLSEVSGKIRTAVAMVIATIGQWDWPEKWPNLVPDLVACLAGGSNSQLAQGAMRCLEMLASADNLSDDHLPLLVNQVFPVMFKIFSSTDWSPKMRKRAANILYSSLNWLSVVKSVQTKVTIQIVSPFLPMWLQHFVNYLAQPDDPLGDCGLKIVILEIMTVLAREFPDQIRDHLSTLMGPTWLTLSNGLAHFENVAVNSDQLDSAGADSDGDVMGFEMLISMLLEFLHVVAGKRSFRKLLLPHLPLLSYVVLGFTQMTEEQVDSWTEDPSQYVEDEDEDSLNYTIRLSAVGLLQLIVEDFETGLKAVVEACIKRLQESLNARASNDENWWRKREASLYMLGTLAPELIAEPMIDLGDLIKNILINDIQPDNVSPFLKGRAIWCASQFIKEDMTGDAAKWLPFLHTATVCLQPPFAPIVVRLCAVRAIAGYTQTFTQEQLTPYLPTILTGLCALLHEVNEDALHLLLEVLNLVLKANHEVTCKYEEVVTPRLISIWAHNVQDALLTTICKDALGILLNIPAIQPTVEDRLLPTLNTILQSPAQSLTLVDEAVELLSVLVLSLPLSPSTPSTPAGQKIMTSFPLLLKIFLTTDDTNLLQSAPACLSAYLTRVGPLVAQWNDGQGNSGLKYILDIVKRLLDPAQSDSAALYVGTLVSKLIQVYAKELGPLLGEILGSVVNRLRTAQLSSLIQSLLLVFARLTQTFLKPLLDFLAAINVEIHDQKLSYLQGTQNGLVYVLSLWTNLHERIQGSFNTKISTLALARIFAENDERLDKIAVRGSLVVDKKEGRSTRARAKQTGAQVEQYTTVPLKLKIFQLLLQEYRSIKEDEEARAKRPKKGYEEGSDDDDDDFDSGDDGGATFEDADFYSSLLDDFVDYDDDDDSDVISRLDDPDMQSDPLFKLDLKQYLEEFFKGFVTQYPHMIPTVNGCLSPEEQKIFALFLVPK